MKLLTPFTAIIAAAAAGQIYSNQPSEAYAKSAEIYQSALEYQQQGLYSDQPHAYSGQGVGEQLHAYSGQGAREQLHAYSGQGAGEQSHAYSGQGAGEQSYAYSGQTAREQSHAYSNQGAGEQLHAYSGQGTGKQLHAYSGQAAKDQLHAYSGQGAGEQLHAYSVQDVGHAGQSLAYSGQEHRPSGQKTARILSFASDSDGHGYQYSYETENGIKAQEIGQVTGHDKGTEAHGGYSYTGDDGHVYTITYTADENGFHAQGAHLPTPPPIPELIAKSLEQNAKDEAAGIYDDGKYQEHQSHHKQIQQSHHHEQSVGVGQHQAQAIQYETLQNAEGFQPGYHTLNVPVEGYKH